MKIIDAYLFRAILSGSALALLILGLLDWVFGFLTQMNHAGVGFGRSLLLSVYTEPRRLYELFPSAVLIGSLMSLGSLAANSELIAMRAAGVSIGGVIRAVLRAGVLMMLFAIAFGEWVVPAGERLAQSMLLQAKAGSSVVTQGQNVWAKDGNEYIHISRVIGKQLLNGITIYAVNPENRLHSIIYAATASYRNDRWVLKQVVITRFANGKITLERPQQVVQAQLVNPDLFGFLNTRPEDMSAMELFQYMSYLRANNLDDSRYALAFWQRLATPLSALVMLILAVPFAFGSLRTGGGGQRLFVGVILGVGFYFGNQLITRVGLIYGVSPFVSAFAPLLLVGLLSLAILARTR